MEECLSCRLPLQDFVPLGDLPLPGFLATRSYTGHTGPRTHHAYSGYPVKPGGQNWRGSPTVVLFEFNHAKHEKDSTRSTGAQHEADHEMISGAARSIGAVVKFCDAPVIPGALGHITEQDHEMISSGSVPNISGW